jgi:O-Antigen ligase
MKPQNFEEKLVWYSLVGIYGIYFLGMLLPASAAIGWVLFFYLCKKVWDQIEDTPVEQRIKIPWIMWLWVIGMVIILIAKIVGLNDFGYEKNDFIRGTLGWLITWVTLALFPIAGCLNIRPKLIYRAVCIVCLQSLIIIPFCYIAFLIHLPGVIYSSPLERIFQNGKLYYDVGFYIYTAYNHELRLGLFAPWGPALGLVGTLYFFLAIQEHNQKWRWLGIVGAIAMCIVSSSRLAFIAVPAISLGVWFLTNFWRPITQIWLGFISFLIGIFSAQVIKTAKDLVDGISGSRSESTRIRKALIEVAFERSKEAPIWGHGTQEASSKALENMPIGSHTTWGGLMFMHGMVGLVAFLVPVICTLITLLIKAQKNPTAKVGLSVLLVLLFFSSGESLDALAYLCWPAWVLIGIALKKEMKTPLFEIGNHQEESDLLIHSP